MAHQTLILCLTAAGVVLTLLGLVFNVFDRVLAWPKLYLETRKLRREGAKPEPPSPALPAPVEVAPVATQYPRVADVRRKVEEAAALKELATCDHRPMIRLIWISLTLAGLQCGAAYLSGDYSRLIEAFMALMLLPLAISMLTLNSRLLAHATDMNAQAVEEALKAGEGEGLRTGVKMLDAHRSN